MPCEVMFMMTYKTALLTVGDPVMWWAMSGLGLNRLIVS